MTTATLSKPDFSLTFLTKGKVINASLMPVVMDEHGMEFTYDAPDGTNYSIYMDRNGRFCAERFEFVEDVGYEVVEGYNHNEAKKIALEAGIIKMRK